MPETLVGISGENQKWKFKLKKHMKNNRWIYSTNKVDKIRMTVIVNLQSRPRAM